MSAILPHTRIDSEPKLAKHFMPHQLHWILGEDAIHAQHRQAYALAEKSVRIGWTYADGFKNVRKRLRFNKRNYLFATKDWPSALEYMNQVYEFANLFNLTGAIVSHGEEDLKVQRLDRDGSSTSFTDEIKIGTIKFDNGSRIIAFSAHPQAMAVHGGDVGLDEFAKHPNARLLWQTAQGRITWGFDMSVWSSHDGEDTQFNQFAQQARASCTAPVPLSHPMGEGSGVRASVPLAHVVGEGPGVKASVPLSHPMGEGPGVRAITPPLHHSITPSSPWNLYYRVTMPDAIQLGLVDVINRSQGTRFTPEQFLADCQARSGSDEIYQQSYLCNPCGASAAAIVDWSAIERCRAHYIIERVDLESGDILQLFGQPSPSNEVKRQNAIELFLRDYFPVLLNPQSSHPPQLRLGFDVAASGRGDLAVFYIDDAVGDLLSLRALLTCRTEDWHFIKTVLFYFLQHLHNLSAAGDESGLGRQICWEAASRFGSRFMKVNFASAKHDLGFALMNQLSCAQKRFPALADHQDIAADFFALRKSHNGARWIFSESTNSFNPASHCDIAWAGALATYAHSKRKTTIGSRLG